MTSLTLVVDEREVRTIRAALLLLQEQIGALPEDLAEMLDGHGRAMTEEEIGDLARRLAPDRERPVLVDGAPAAARLVEVTGASRPLTARR